jgi:hypothetical protein
MRLAAIALLTILAIWAVAGIVVVLMPYVLGFIVLVFAFGCVGRIWDYLIGNKKSVDQLDEPRI